ncbi:MAG: exo-alpha-sialidase [Myxococcales bacterium]
MLGVSVVLLAGAGTFAAIRFHRASPAKNVAAPRQHAGFGKQATGPDKRAERLLRLQQGLPGADPAAGLGGPLSREEEKLADRALPFDTLPLEMTDHAQQSAAQIANFHDADEEMPFRWRSIGPTNAVYPALLNRTAANYVTSGRITALAIDPRCGRDGEDEGCRLYVGAAGGGIWKTEDALARQPKWEFISGAFATNAIGSLTLDPADPDTIYVGTGEPNISADSAAGLGIYKSSDRGATWTLLPAVATVDTVTYRNFARNLAISSVVIDPTDRRTLYVGAALGVRGVSAVGGATGLIPGRAPVGVYKSTDGGATFSRIWDANKSVRGVNAVALDPSNPSIVYASAVQKGIWRSWAGDKSGAAFQPVFLGQSRLVDPDRTEFALARLPSGKTRIYAATGAVGPIRGFAAPKASESQVWRIDDATRDAATLVAEQDAVVAGGSPAPGGWKKLTESAPGAPGFATYNFCTGQCWYDIGVFTPAGAPDTVFVIGSYQYYEAGRASNSRSVLRSTTAGEPDPAGVTFTDLSRDAASPQNGIHPDQHALVFLPGNPAVWFEGSDGGLMRASGKYVSLAAQCKGRSRLSPAQVTTCERLLSAVPTELTSLNFGLNTLQFQSLSINPQKPLRELLGGTQDNGTFQYEGSSVTWMQTIFGDGGQSGFDAANPVNRFHTYYAPQVDVNFRGGDPLYWLWISDPFFPGGRQVESASFYIPIIPDPSPARGGTIFAGLQSIWRTQDNGGARAFLEANCGELLPAEDPDAICGDWVRISPKLAVSTPTDPDSWIAALARAPGDTTTLWTATRTGKVFVSRNADAPTGAVTWTRLDLLSPAAPNRFPSAIDVDATNPLHAFIAYSGYSANTPARRGHVFDVVYDPATGTATWTSLDEGLGDLPVTALVRDQASGDLYAGTDFGVMRRQAATGHWHVASRGMPAVEVTQLSYSPVGKVVYAATHGRGAYRLTLPDGSDQD